MIFSRHSDILDDCLNFLLVLTDGQTLILDAPFNTECLGIYDTGEVVFNRFFDDDEFLKQIVNLKTLFFPSFGKVPAYAVIALHELGHIHQSKIKKTKVKRLKKTIQNFSKYDELAIFNIKNHLLKEKELLADKWADDFINNNLQEIKKSCELVEKGLADDYLRSLKKG